MFYQFCCEVLCYIYLENCCIIKIIFAILKNCLYCMKPFFTQISTHWRTKSVIVFTLVLKFVPLFVMAVYLPKWVVDSHLSRATGHLWLIFQDVVLQMVASHRWLADKLHGKSWTENKVFCSSQSSYRWPLLQFMLFY